MKNGLKKKKRSFDMFKYYNSNLIISNRSYSTEKIQKLIDIHPQTIRSWCNEGGLTCISKKPILIYGAILKEFIKNRNESHKKTLEFNQMKCFRCKAISVPKNNEVTLYNNKNGSIRAVAIHSCCEKIELSKLYKKIDIEKLKQVFFIKPIEPTLCNSLCNSSKTNINEAQKTSLCESKNKESQKSKKLSSKTNIKQPSLFDYDL